MHPLRLKRADDRVVMGRVRGQDIAAQHQNADGGDGFGYLG